MSSHGLRRRVHRHRQDRCRATDALEVDRREFLRPAGQARGSGVVAISRAPSLNTAAKIALIRTTSASRASMMASMIRGMIDWCAQAVPYSGVPQRDGSKRSMMLGL